jgi:hypothetical protein
MMTRLTLAAGLVPALSLMAGLGEAATLSPFLVSDQGADEVLLATDLNGDGDTNDPGEMKVFYSAANASGLPAGSGNVFSLSQVADGSVLIGDGDTDSVYRLRDEDFDGTAQGEGEARVWFSGSGNAAGFRLNTPNGIAEGPDGAVYVVEADTGGFPTGDWVYRTVDLNGDGDANDAGEATRWLDLKAVNPASSPFEIRFDGDTAYVMDTAGATPNVIYAARDADGNGVVEGTELRTFASQTTLPGVNFDFAMDVGLGSVWTWQWLPVNGVSSVFRLTDLDGSGLIDAAEEAVEVWNTTLLDPAYTFLAGFGLDLNDATGEIFITSNAGAENGRWILRLLDRDGDGSFWDEGEGRVVLSGDAQGTYPDRPRNVAVYEPQVAPVPLPAALPLLLAGLGGLALLRRSRA